ncbi:MULTISPECIES: hypothetical protein [unclassified Ornithinimicrobium]|uniref:hypothetical protein n=1 Tax=unclassified Ornithinimicrobium TaxID=2615080 RepID=UPI003853BF5A
MPDEPTPPPQRVRVTSSRRGAAAPRRRTRATALVEQTGVGELYLQGLLQSQLRLALVVLGLGAATLLGLPLLFLLVPASQELRVLGLPFPWVALGVLLYPAMVGIAAWYVVRAERVERRFTDVVTRER